MPTTSENDASEPLPRRARRQAGRTSNRLWIAVLATFILLIAALIVIAVRAAATHPHVHGKVAPVPTLPTTTASNSANTGGICPLTGLPAPGGSIPARPALAIKVDNYSAARPQTGINHADIVFEEPVEGGITRFVAVFQCHGAKLVGPIRSARLVDVDILSQLSDPILANMGGIPPVISAIQKAPIIEENMLGLGQVIHRNYNRVPPYNTYASTSALWGLHSADTTAPAQLFTYSNTVPAGTPAASVHVPFSYASDVTWNYDPTTHQYLRYYNGTTPAMLSDGTQISAANLVIQSVRVTYGPWVENSLGGLEVVSHMIGSGPLIVVRNGVAVSGTWQRPSLTSPTVLTAANGSTIALQPGNTWVEIVPNTVSVTTAP